MDKEAVNSNLIGYRRCSIKMDELKTLTLTTNLEKFKSGYETLYLKTISTYQDTNVRLMVMSILFTHFTNALKNILYLF